MRFRFRYFRPEDRVQFSLATEDMQFACWLTRQQCVSWLAALASADAKALSTVKPASGPRAAARGNPGKTPLELPLQQLRGVTFRAGRAGVSTVFKPEEGEDIRFTQGPPLVAEIGHTLYSVALRAGWDPDAALERVSRGRIEKAKASSTSLH